MLEHLDGGLREPAAIDDRGVVQLIGNDQVVLAQDRGDGSRVGRKAGLKHYAGFRVFETRDLLFELHVDLHRAGNGAHRSGSHAPAARGFERGTTQSTVCGEAEVIVRAEVDDLLAVETGHRLLFAFEHAQAEVKPFGFQLFELLMQIGERLASAGGCTDGAHGPSHALQTEFGRGPVRRAAQQPQAVQRGEPFG